MTTSKTQQSGRKELDLVNVVVVSLPTLSLFVIKMRSCWLPVVIWSSSDAPLDICVEIDVGKLLADGAKMNRSTLVGR